MEKSVDRQQDECRLLSLARQSLIHDVLLKKMMKKSITMSIVAAVLAFVLYPSFIMPIGPWTNGGLGGLIVLLCATGAAWFGFATNPDRRWLRWLLQIPITIGSTYCLIHELIVHFMSKGHYLGL